MVKLEAEENCTDAIKPPVSQSFANLIKRLSRAGFGKDFVRRAILPEWWDERCSEDPRLVEDIEIRVARFFGCSVTTLKDPHSALTAASYPGAQLRRVRDVNRDRLAPAIHTAIRIASAVVRNLRDASRPGASPGLPTDGLSWRNQIECTGSAPTLKDIVANLWSRGIPVVPVEGLPTPGFQGIACIVEQQPVILLGYKHDEPGRVAFIVAHEAGHVALDHCAPDQPVVDEEDEISDDADVERQADAYATQVLVGDSRVPQLLSSLRDFKDLARQASKEEGANGADASVVIFDWARRTGDYATATMAVKALYRNTGARELLREAFDRHVDIEAAAETDRALLRCFRSASMLDEADH